jgi:hypothetical protein
MDVNVKVPMAFLPVASTDFTSDATFEHPGGSAAIRCCYQREAVTVKGGVRFARVRSYRFRTEAYCTAWHVQDAYDTISEVVSSDWLNELRVDEQESARGRWELHHFILYIDSVGCFELAAESWSWLEDVVST